MAFNNWPYTNFQDLNLGWILNKIKEAITKADNANDTVGQFDSRITANSNAILALSDEVEAFNGSFKIFVNSDREAYSGGNHITGSEIYLKMQSEGEFPYVEFNGEVYMPDTVSSAGDIRFTVVHTDNMDNVIIRRILIPAQSYNAGYSIVNVGSGSGSSNAVVFEITDGTCNRTYAELLSAWNSGKALVANIKSGSNVIATSALVYKETVTQSGGTQIDRFTIIDPYLSMRSPLSVNARYVYSDNTVSYGYLYSNIATLDGVITMINDGITTDALVKTAQTLTAAEQAQVKQNLGITSGESSGMTQIPITSSGGVYSTTMTATELIDCILDNGCFAVVNGVYYVLAGSSFSGPNGNIYLQSVDQSGATKTDVSVILLHMDSNYTPSVTVTLYEKDILLLPATTNASADDFLMLDSNKNPAWVAVPNAANVSFGGV